MAERTCSIDGCEKPHLARGWCVTHYTRWRKHGDPLQVADRMKTGGACLVDGCDKIARTRGLCPAHYQRQRTAGSVEADKPLRPRASGPVECSVAGCSNIRHSQGLCSPHAARLRLWGELRPEVPLGAFRRTGYCSVEGCEEPAVPGALCRKHLAREGAFERNSRRRMRVRLQFVETVDPLVVFERDDWTCQLCGCELNRVADFPHPFYPTVDHILPLALGGEHSYANAQAVCYRCNCKKGARVA